MGLLGRTQEVMTKLWSPPAEEALWTTQADGRVRLRMDPSCPQLPYTVHRMFYEALDKYGDLGALGFKRQDKWEHISYCQYYQIARRAAKGFLKVRVLKAPFPLPRPASSLGPRRPPPHGSPTPISHLLS
jgi:long-chain-fatty-acid--CoA ligase ACSBG